MAGHCTRCPRPPPHPPDCDGLQLDVSQGLALGLLALIAFLPEYIVDATCAWKAAAEPAYDKYAVANMTGASRILIGAAWPLVVLLGWVRWRRAGHAAGRDALRGGHPAQGR